MEWVSLDMGCPRVSWIWGVLGYEVGVPGYGEGIPGYGEGVPGYGVGVLGKKGQRPGRAENLMPRRGPHVSSSLPEGCLVWRPTSCRPPRTLLLPAPPSLCGN